MSSASQSKTIDNLTYLGSTLSHKPRIDDEVAQRISKASQTLGRLQASVGNRDGLQLYTKLKVYETAIMATLLYGAKTKNLIVKLASTPTASATKIITTILTAISDHTADAPPPSVTGTTPRKPHVIHDGANHHHQHHYFFQSHHKP
nr:unnamed protein product [Spirometra erinaceieuropaei]